MSSARPTPTPSRGARASGRTSVDRVGGVQGDFDRGVRGVRLSPKDQRWTG
jgi:hypothetical protein